MKAALFILTFYVVSHLTFAAFTNPKAMEAIESAIGFKLNKWVLLLIAVFLLFLFTRGVAPFIIF